MLPESLGWSFLFEVMNYSDLNGPVVFGQIWELLYCEMTEELFIYIRHIQTNQTIEVTL